MTEEVSLREHIEALMRAQALQAEQRYQAQQSAILSALASLNMRLDLLNELREGVATKTELDGLEKRMNAMDDRLNELSSRLDRIEGRSTGLNASWVYLLGIVAAAGTVATIIVMAMQ